MRMRDGNLFHQLWHKEEREVFSFFIPRDKLEYELSQCINDIPALTQNGGNLYNNPNSSNW